MHPTPNHPASPQTLQKLVAECVGKNQEVTFCTSCLYPPVSTAAGPSTTVATEASRASEGSSCSGIVGSCIIPSALPSVLFPRWSFKESYFIAAGPLQRSTTFRPPNGVLPEEVPDEEWPREAVLLLYKTDALARHLMPEENQSRASKSLLEKMLADLQAPKVLTGR